MALIHRACSWAAHKRISVWRLSFLLFSHSHLFSSSVLAVSLKNWSWRAFSFHSVKPYFLLSCQFWTFINYLSFSSVVAGMISYSLLLRPYSLLWLQAPYLLHFLVGTTTQRLILDVVHHNNLSCFLIHFLHFLFCPFNNASTVLISWHQLYVYCLEYMLCIKCWF